MKKSFCTFLSLVLAVSLAWGGPGAGYTIGVSVKGYRTGQLYLGNYYGHQTYVIDSAVIGADGRAVFKGAASLEGGIYFVLLPEKKRYFEVLIDTAQHFSVEADTTESFRHLVFTGSADNVLFADYNAFLRTQQEKMSRARSAGKDSAALHGLDRQISGEVNQYRDGFIRKHPGTLLSMIFKAMEDPKVPESVQQDSAAAYHYYRAHYWDNVNLRDNRILRTPVLETRLQRYFSQLIPPVADSVNAAADDLLQTVHANKEMFKYVLWWLTYTYETSPYMGMDAVFVHLVEKYYMTGQAYWLSKEQTQKIIDRASQLAPNLIGNRAPDLALRTPDSAAVSLSGIQAKYTILIFWDPTCGHCQIVVPKLDSAYRSHWKQQGVKVMGVLAGGTQKQWTDYISAHHLDDWINAWDPGNQTNYRRLYDVYMTPIIYLLDADKKILAKKLDVAQLDHFLTRLAQQE